MDETPKLQSSAPAGTSIPAAAVTVPANTTPGDENLPEVVPYGSAPEWVSPTVARSMVAGQMEEKDPKFPVMGEEPGTGRGDVEKNFSGTGMWGSSSALENKNGHMFGFGLGHGEGGEEKRILGMRRKVFWLVVLLVVLLVGLAMGLGIGLGKGNGDAADDGGTGGVGGDSEPVSEEDGTRSNTITATKTETTTLHSSPAGSGTGTASHSATTSSTTATASATSTTPSATIIGTGSYSFMGWTLNDYQGSQTPQYSKEGIIDLPFGVTSYVWAHGESGCCLTFCQGAGTSLGYRCDDKNQPSSSAEFDRVNIWCDGDVTAHKAECS